VTMLSYCSGSATVLLEKVKSYGVDDKELKWFTSYLFQRSQCVTIKNSTSDLMPIYN
jgi:hypothetical protein